MLENGSAVGDNLSYVSLSSLDSSCGHLSNFLDRTENPMSSSYNAESTFASLHSLLQTFTRLSMTRRVSLRSLLSSSKQNLDCFFQQTLSSFSFFYHPYSPFIIFVPLSPVCLPGINSSPLSSSTRSPLIPFHFCNAFLCFSQSTESESRSRLFVKLLSLCDYLH